MPFDNLPELKPALCPDAAARKVLRDAAERVRKGWCQGKLYYDGKVCALGALIDVAGGNLGNTSDRAEFQNPGFERAVAAFERYVGTDIALWNDTPGRRAEEVIAAMRAAGDTR